MMRGFIAAGLAAYCLSCSGEKAPQVPQQTSAQPPALDGGKAIVLPAVVDTIAIGEYVAFVRPLRSLTVRPEHADDFRPYVVDMQEDTFSFVVEGQQYLVAPYGAGYRVVNAGAPQAFVLPVDTGMFIERLAFTRIDGDPILLIQETDNEGGSGIAIRLDSAGLGQRWKAPIPGFNVGFALRDGRYLYVTCIGFIGKLDVNTGQYVWRHDDLYDTEKFNNFQRPRIRGDTVEFPSDNRSIRVDRQTGRRFSP